METESQDEKQTAEETADIYTDEETLTLHEFINRWNNIDPGRLSGETETFSVENGIISGLGYLGGSDSYSYVLNRKDNTIRGVVLNLTYSLSEDEEHFYIGDNIVHDISVLIDVLEPELEDGDKERILKSLGANEGYRISKVSVKVGKVTYTADNGDDRFWLDASVDEY